MFPLDTNVVSELRQGGRGSAGVSDWYDGCQIKTCSPARWSLAKFARELRDCAGAKTIGKRKFWKYGWKYHRIFSLGVSSRLTPPLPMFGAKCMPSATCPSLTVS